MNNKYHHIAIALAGATQSAILVPQLANTGICSATLYEQAIKSIFKTSPKTTDDVYDGIKNIKIGLQTLIQLLSSGQKEHVQTIRYLFGSLSITNKLLKNKDALDKIDQRLKRISGLYSDINDQTVGINVDDISYSLAGIYSDIISPISTKIKVIGKIEFLQNSLVQAKVRTALLGCVRSAILWYQVGGSRFQFLFSRKRICDAAQQLLDQINRIN
ncbi:MULTISPECIES: high frequency lysogenization protein HflD [unclassified Gilliamella]|uniref:high frequency lysogenization protein HflD n=1 Tax=unclassified Gilliamella TaxID=2685620 RepID=UPI00132C0EE8|nr:high frequency lysogenization protein HflD [Gilliamella sp. Pra-s60]MWP29939.1 high frequency lysogenization protein HflD [Gilliamella sp. Pra-s54]MWP46137.1 high frequency lysogenization protein HflD [Gilliamella sp. Pas-s27]